MLGHLEPSGLFVALWNHLGYLGPFGAIWGYVGLSGSIWGHLGLLCGANHREQAIRNQSPLTAFGKVLISLGGHFGKFGGTTIENRPLATTPF